jgi:hypothetical protein
MPRKTETQDERVERLTKNAQQLRQFRREEDDELDAMVRRSIKLHGA